MKRSLLASVLLLVSTVTFADYRFEGKEIVEMTMSKLKTSRSLNCQESTEFENSAKRPMIDHTYVMEYNCKEPNKGSFKIKATFKREKNNDLFSLRKIKLNPRNLNVPGYDVLALTEVLDATELYVKKNFTSLDFSEIDDHWTCWDLLNYGRCNRDSIKIYSNSTTNRNLELRVRAKGRSNRWENEFLVQDQYVATLKFKFTTK